MNLFHLLDRSEERLAANEPAFNEHTEVVQAILKAVGALPFRRASLNRELHQLVAASIVVAHEADDTIDITTRRAGTLHHYGYSTKIVQFLDAAVEQGLLVSQTGKAKGALSLGDILGVYLDEAQLILA